MVKKYLTLVGNTKIDWNASLVGYVPQEGQHIVKKDNLVLRIHLVPKEEFVFTIDSGKDSSFTLPLSSKYATTNGIGTYDMNVDWGDGNKENIKGSVVKGGGVKHDYSKQSHQYTITLTPSSDTNGWGASFGFDPDNVGSSLEANRDKILSLDSPLTKKMVYKTGSENNVMYGIFADCANLTLSERFNLPQDFETVGTAFGSHLFALCTSIKRLPEKFNIPQGITTVGEEFLQQMFYECSELQTLPETFSLPQELKTVGDFFGESMFSGCSSLTHLPHSLTIPTNLETAGLLAFSNMFNSCTLLSKGITHFFNGIVLPQEQLDNNSVFENMFAHCDSNSEEISPKKIPQLTVVPSAPNGCFLGIPHTENCPRNWK